ncbi:MAG: glycosyltransferase family 4 protein, partial [Planctomycetes bacterium]|nr:glycosyltransferase family 4 protein [Planctomycetota bacterium]
EGDLKQSLEGTIARFKPDIVHAHDVTRCGTHLLGLRMPWVVSVSAEDFHVDMAEGQMAPLVCEVYRRAHRVIVPSTGLARELEGRLPETVGKIDVVPRAVRPLPTGGTDLRRSLGVPRHRVLILLPGGLRPIKGQHRSLALIRILRRSGVDAEMVIAGPVQDPEYAADLKSLIRDEPSIRIMSALSSERMGATYMDADVVLNTSLDEVMSPSILEAGILGRPVVASRVPGNEELVRHLETGLLYDGEEEMAKCILALVRNRSAAGAYGVRMREDFKRRFDPEVEIDRLLSAYAAA